MINLINANSPMVFDEYYAGRAQGLRQSTTRRPSSHPFILSGAMAPVTPVGVMTQTLGRSAWPGSPTPSWSSPARRSCMGSFASSISMQSGAPTFGTPEPALVLYGMAELARRLGVPFRSGWLALRLQGARRPGRPRVAPRPWCRRCMAGVNFVLHAAGWLEGGLVSSFEKFIIDADQLGMMQLLASGYDLSENGQAMDALREVGPGSHFLGCAHTQANFETAFYRSAVADNNSFEQWESEGSLDTAWRANALWKRWLADYEAPAIDPAVDEALQAFVQQRKDSMPDAFA